MDNIERRNAEMAYKSDTEIFEQQKITRRIIQRLNTIDVSDFEGIAAIVKELFGSSENAFINPPFYCDYGFNIHAGKNLFINYNCTILDVSPVIIGDNCFIAPNVGIYTAGHPIHPVSRVSGYEYGRKITIGDNVWIGGNSVICPGVSIGSNTVIAAGSIVTKDIPEWVVAGGNPCKIIKKITEEDKKYIYKNVEFDEESMEEINEIKNI